MAQIVLTFVAILLIIFSIAIAAIGLKTAGPLANDPLALAASLYPSIELLLTGIVCAAIASAIGYLGRIHKEASRTSQLLEYFADRQRDESRAGHVPPSGRPGGDAGSR
jgi:hypothetical protein